MFVFASISYIFGIMLALTYNITSYTYILLAILILLIAYALIKKHLWQLLLVISLVCGMFVTNLYLLFKPTIMLNEPIKLGYIYAKVDRIDSSYFNNKSYIYLDEVIINNNLKSSISIPNRIKLYYNNNIDFKVNDIIKLQAFLYPPSPPLLPYGFNFAKNSYFNNIGANGYVVGKVEVIYEFENTTFISTIINKIITWRYIIKKYIIKQINMVNLEISPLIASILIGEYNFLPEDNLNDLRNSGLAHLISISGYHISIISGLIFFIVRGMLSLNYALSVKYSTKKIASVITIILLLLYIFIVGNHIPAVRASIMAIAVFISIIFGFSSYAFNSLFLAVVIILSYNPFALYSAGFILSSFSTLIIIAFIELPIVKKLYNIKVNKYINIPYKIFFYLFSCLIITLIIEISIAPILGFYFGSIPVFSIIANMLVAPIFAFILMPSLLAYLLLPFFISKYFLIISGYSTKYILYIANFFANYSINNTLSSQIYLYNIYGYILIIYLFSVVIIISIYFNKNKYKNLNYAKYACILVLLIISVYYYKLPKHYDIIIDNNADLIAFKEGNDANEYVFSNKGNKFIKQVWFKDSNINYNYTFNNSIYLQCLEQLCIANKNNYIISFLVNAMEYEEACKESNIIIMQVTKPYNCSKAIVIDKSYVNTHGATGIYLNNNSIKIVSNN